MINQGPGNISKETETPLIDRNKKLKVVIIHQLLQKSLSMT